MAIIKNHPEFIRAVREIAHQNERDDVVEAIDSDMRDRMTEPDYYGLKALEAAENYFDSLDWSAALKPGVELDGGFYAMYRCPERTSPVYAPAVYINNTLHTVLFGGGTMPYDEDWGWEFIAFQEWKPAPNFLYAQRSHGEEKVVAIAQVYVREVKGEDSLYRCNIKKPDGAIETKYLSQSVRVVNIVQGGIPCNEETKARFRTGWIYPIDAPIEWVENDYRSAMRWDEHC